ncbi:uncharacterized protein LOC141829629 isoform X2 [Curcuma longa]|uniref:uncharacterized protein LOC141829629 isoform X2 n=1 Tax=Curcuma longa TaxID=136217 RepID=UPI003D9F378D
MSLNRDMDVRSVWNEREVATDQFTGQLEVDCVEDISLAGKSISGWLNELDVIAKQVEAELISRDIDIMFSVVYVEVCQRLGVNIVGSKVGEDFLIWPQSGNSVELFSIASGRSLFATINGKCVKDPRSMASEMDSNSVSRLDIATKRDIIGIALANLIRFYWKRASKANHGLMLTSPLKPVYPGTNKAGMGGILNIPLLRPQDLRLAIMASERLLILQPGNWTLRRDHGMLLYYSRRYAEAVQELSICMAFAPEEEAEILEPFVEKLHLLRLLSSWECLDQSGSVPIS